MAERRAQPASSPADLLPSSVYAPVPSFVDKVQTTAKPNQPVVVSDRSHFFAQGSSTAFTAPTSKKQKLVKPQFTKRQLARLVDPSDFHVMPSSFNSTKVSSMEPPKRVLPKQTILNEDEFVDAVAAIVQRDFFPDLPKLKAQVAWLEASEQGDTERMQQISAGYTRSLRRKLHSQTDVTPSPLQSSEEATLRVPTGSTCEVSASGNTQNRTSRITSEVGLDRWLAKHNGEDNASFEELLENDKEKHREKYWWAFNDGAKAGSGFQMLKDGTVERIGGNPIAKHLPLKDATGRESAGASMQAKLALEGGVAPTGGNTAHKLGAGSGLGVGGWKGDDRKPNLDLPTYRSRNHLMFQPELSTTREICGLPPKQTRESAIVAFRKGKHGRRVYKAPKQIQHKNTRFAGDPDAYNEAAAVVAAAADEERRKAAEKGHQMGGGNYDYVATPKIIPGQNIAPLITWGSVDGTPLLLHDAMGITPIVLHDKSRNDFKIQPSGSREKLAARLEAGVRVKQKRKRERASARRTPGRAMTPAGVPGSRRRAAPGRSSILLTPSQRRLSHLSPAARSIAQRLAQERSSAFGSDSKLRASYAGMGRTSRGANSSLRRSFLRGEGSTPTPIRHHTGESQNAKKRKGKKKCRLESPTPPARPTTSITDNLLKF